MTHLPRFVGKGRVTIVDYREKLVYFSDTSGVRI